MLALVNSFGPALITVLGAFIAATGAFWKSEHDLRSRHDSNLKVTRKPALVILVGALLSVVGALWSAQRQANSAQERAQFERDLRLKSDQITALSIAEAKKSDDLARLNHEIAQKSEEIARLNQEIAASVTGGDEFAYLDPLLAEDQLRVFLIIEHRGRYPIYDVGFRVLDFRIMGTKPMAEEMLSNTFTVGNLAARERRFVSYWPLVPGKTHYGFNFFFTARNARGFTVQEIRFVKEKGKWLSATKVTPYNSRNVLYSRVDPGFPRRPDGQIDWNDEAYSNP